MNLMLCNLSWESVVLTGWLSTLIVVTGATCFYFWLKYSKQPMLQNQHEKEMKEKAFEREKEWYFISKLEKPIIEVNTLKQENEGLQKKVNDLQGQIDKSDEDHKKEMLEKERDIYKNIIEQLNLKLNITNK